MNETLSKIKNSIHNYRSKRESTIQPSIISDGPAEEFSLGNNSAKINLNFRS